MRPISHRTSSANRVEMNQGGRKRRLVSQLNAATQLEGTDPFFLTLPRDLNLDDGDTLSATTRWGNRGRCGIFGASGHEPTVTIDPLNGRKGIFVANAATDTWLNSEQDALDAGVTDWHLAISQDSGEYSGTNSRSMFFYSTGTNFWTAGQGGWIFNLSGGVDDVPAAGISQWGADTSFTEIEYEANTIEPDYFSTFAQIVRRTAGTGRYPHAYMDQVDLTFNATETGYVEGLPTGASYRFSLGAYSGGDIPFGGLFFAIAFWDYDTDATELKRRQNMIRGASYAWSK